MNEKKPASPLLPQQEVKEFLQWKAPGRPFKKHSRQYYLIGLTIVALVEISVFFFHQYMLMLVVLSLFFLAIVLAVTPPHDFTYKISTEGVMVEDHFFLWRELYDFYFKKQNSVEVLIIRTHTLIPGALILTLDGMDKEKVKTTLLPYLPFREYVKPNFIERSGDWLARTFPLEKLEHMEKTMVK